MPRASSSCFRWWSSPVGQTVVLGVIFFLIFAAFYVLQGLAALLLGPALASNALATLYAVFTGACLYAPYVVNRYGPRVSLRLGILGFCALSVATLVNSYRPSKSAVIFGGALNGLGAAILWTAQGRLMLANGNHFAVFWSLFNASAVVGGVATFVYASTSKDPENSDPKNSAALFGSFVVLMGLGALCTVFLSKDNNNDEHHQEEEKVQRQAAAEVKATVKLLLTRHSAALGCLYFYTGFNQPYQLDLFGDRYFSKKVVGLELALFYGMSVVAGKVAERCLAAKRPRRAAASRTLSLFALTSAAAFGLAAKVVVKDTDDNILVATLAFALWGFSSSVAQAYCYWLVDILYEDDDDKSQDVVVARAVALYKLIQSFGWCVGFALLPVQRCPRLVQFLLNAVSCGLGFLLALCRLPGDDSLRRRRKKAKKNNLNIDAPLLLAAPPPGGDYSASDDASRLDDDDDDDDSSAAAAA